MKREIDPKDYDFMFKVENLSFFFASWWVHRNYEKLDCIVTQKDKIWRFYLSKKDRKKLSEKGLRLMEYNMVDFRKETIDLINKAKKLFPKIEKENLKQYNNKILSERFLSLIMFVRRLWEQFFFTEFFMHDKILEKANKLRINEKEYLTSSPKEILASKEYYDRCKLALNLNEKFLKKHVKKYSFIKYSEGGDTYSLKQLKKDIKEIKNPKKEIKSIDKKHKEIIKQRRKNKLADSIREMAEIKWLIRSFLNKTWFGENNLIHKYLKVIEKRLHKSDLSNFHYKEVIEMLEGNKINEVDRSTFVFGKFNDWKPIEGNKAEKIIKILEGIYKKKVDELKGRIANKGYYKGIVKIIPFEASPNMNVQIEKMKKGEVLVTGSTGPEMIKACHKAGAIITEEGGICSHAAIVSREFGIPCIVGTEIATDIFKDGDYIEVDANKGVVRKLK